MSGATYKQGVLSGITFFQTISDNQRKFEALEWILIGSCAFGNLMTDFEF